MVIDGSRGEGGGALLRQALGLAIYAGRRIRIVNVRARRRTPGLRAQHLKAIEAAALLSGATVEGATLGSRDLLFAPGPTRSGAWEVDVGTAGAITLVLQSVLLPALARREKVRFSLVGGTDTTWAPPADYLDRVTFSALSGFGRGRLSVERRGYYPRGAGKAIALLDGVGVPAPLELVEAPSVAKLGGVSHASSSLRPRRVAERQAQAAERGLASVGPVDVAVSYSEAPSPGSGIVLWTEGSEPPLAGSALGARGRPAEEVGATAALALLRELDSGAAVDRHLADQLVPFLAVAGGRLKTSEISGHTRSSVEVARELLGVGIEIDDDRCVIEAAAPPPG